MFLSLSWIWMSQFKYELGVAISTWITDVSSVLNLFPLLRTIYHELCFLFVYYGAPASFLISLASTPHLTTLQGLDPELTNTSYGRAWIEHTTRNSGESKIIFSLRNF